MTLTEGIDQLGTVADPVTSIITNTVLGGIIGEGFSKFTVQTTDATTTTLGSITITEEDTQAYRILVTGRGPSDKNFWKIIEGGVRRNTAGNATKFGTETVSEGSEGTPGYTFVTDISGGDLRIRVTGAVAETVNWQARYIDIASGASSPLVDVFQSSDFAHGVFTGTNSATYTFNHNRDKIPDLIQVFDLTNPAIPLMLPDMIEIGANRLYFQTASSGLTLDTHKLRIFRVFGVSTTLRVLLYWFNNT